MCAENGFYWVSGSTTLAKYDRDWNLLAKNTDPFKGYETEVNHIGDIDVYENGVPVLAEDILEKLHDPAAVCAMLELAGLTVERVSDALLPDSGLHSSTWYVLARKGEITT